MRSRIWSAMNRTRQTLRRALHVAASSCRPPGWSGEESDSDQASRLNSDLVYQSRNTWLRALSAGECREWLARHHEGRLSYETGRGSRSVVVPYAITGDQVMLRLPAFNEIVQYAPGERVRLDVDGAAAQAGEFDAVSVTGTAQLAGARDARATHLTDFAESWPAGVNTSVICMPMLDIEGMKRHRER